MFGLKKLKDENKKLKDDIINLQNQNQLLNQYINSVQNKNQQLNQYTNDLQNKNQQLNQCINDLKNKIHPSYMELEEIEKKTNNLKMQINHINNNIINNERQLFNSKEELKSINETISNKKNELIIMDDQILMQDFGLYQPIYNFANSSIYKNKLLEIREQQKIMIKNNVAAFADNTFYLNGSIKEGKKVIADNIKQILKTFNEECETLIDKVKYNNIESVKKRIHKSFNDLNKLNSRLTIRISSQYLDLKLQEMYLAYEYQVKKQKEKEELARIREEKREEQKALKELEEARKESLKEEKHYQQALEQVILKLNKSINNIEKEYLLNRKQELETKVEEIKEEIATIDYRVANQRAGYVYVISNIGSFGENVYKIGMTRRLNPQERIDELSSASVPFKFDVHAMIFSNDAPALENSLHKEFSAKKINVVNQRKEFFNVSLKEIEDFIKENYDKTVEFIEIPCAQEYRETMKYKEKNIEKN